MKRAFTVVYERTNEGYTVTVPVLPGVVTEGRTQEEARRMAEDAIRCHVESLLKDGESVPSELEVGVERLEVELPAT